MTLVADFNSSVNVPFQRMRQQQLDGALQEGVVGATDLKVVQRGAGANQSVDVGAGFAWVQIDTGTRNGMGHVTNDATANVTVTASDATNPRIDQIILRWNDTSIPTGSGNVPTLAVLTGTATSGATLDNRTGAAALPNDCLRLADILVPATSTSVTTANIRDRRPWARGAFFSQSTTVTGTVFGTGGTDTGVLNVRIECSGAPLEVTGVGQAGSGTANALAGLMIYMDGAASGVAGFIPTPGGSGAYYAVPLYGTISPAAGSHVFTLRGQVASGATQGNLSAATATSVAFRERISPNTSNT